MAMPEPEVFAKEDCLRHNPDADDCKGWVTTRYSELGTAIRECDYHMGRSLERNARTREEYPDSPNPPAWFDATAAGERWDDDY